MANRSSQRRVRCLLCPDATPTLNNFTNHIKTRHPEHAGKPRQPFYAELDGTPPGRRGRPPARANVAPVIAAGGPEPQPVLPPLDADDIVLTVSQQLAEPSGMFPVVHLPALFAWREATATFLRSVSRDSHG